MKSLASVDEKWEVWLAFIINFWAWGITWLKRGVSMSCQV